MTAPPLPDHTTDQTRFLIAVADQVDAYVIAVISGRLMAAFIRANVALWRVLAERHQPMEFGRKIYCKGHTPAVLHAECPDLLAAVTAARAYLGRT